MDYYARTLDPDNQRVADDGELINVLAQEDMPAVRLAEKIKAAGLDLVPICNAEHAPTEWMLERFPALNWLRAEMIEEGYERPDDDDVWWAACNAAYNLTEDWAYGERQWRGTLEARA